MLKKGKEGKVIKKHIKINWKNNKYILEGSVLSRHLVLISQILILHSTFFNKINID